MVNILIIGIGGFLGAISRYFVSSWSQNLPKLATFPVGTLVVNITGCLAIGIIFGLVESRNVFNPETRLFLLIGFLGSFTTFSTFGFETFSFFQDGQIGAALLNIALNLIIGLLATWFGYGITNSL
ncbi:MAG: fluoride efflux transporter CrcB [Chlorobi bacterium]|nr:fluoride efflux transporter CrcB [Chlorobiota bacterium]